MSQTNRDNRVQDSGRYTSIGKYNNSITQDVPYFFQTNLNAAKKSEMLYFTHRAPNTFQSHGSYIYNIEPSYGQPSGNGGTHPSFKNAYASSV